MVRTTLPFSVVATYDVEVLHEELWAFEEQLGTVESCKFTIIKAIRVQLHCNRDIKTRRRCGGKDLIDSSTGRSCRMAIPRERE